jgi:hypothetical protein
MSPTRKFSFSWSVGMFFLHIGITIALAFILFAAGMASFTSEPGIVFHGGKLIMWVWSPFAMAASNGNSRIGITPEFAAFLWSVVVGILAGFIIPLFLKPKVQKQLMPGANPDLVGTPWEQKASVKSDTLREAQQKQAEQIGDGDAEESV